MLSPNGEYPILAKNGYAAIGWSTLSADRMLSPKEEYPILAKNVYAAIRWSTLSADRMLSPKGEYPILAKKGYATIGYSTLSADRMLAAIRKSTIPREIVLDDGKDEKYYSVISVRALARASGVMSEPLSIRAIS